MKRQRAAGILVHEGRILLIKDAPTNPDLEGLWSLPLVAVTEHENCEHALVRTVEKKIGLTVCVSEKPPVHDGVASEIAIFALSLASHFAETLASADQEHAFFEFHGLPQHVHIDSLLSIIKYRISDPSMGEHPFAVIDRVFASIFYSHLARHFKHPDIGCDVEIFKYIVVSTPYRKFKSVVPFLLSGCNLEKSHLFLLPELCFAVWTLLDDCHDETSHRYGSDSAPLRFGKRASTVALFTSLHTIKGLLERTLSSSYANRIITALVHSASALIQRGRNTLDTDIDSYLDQSVGRTEFLRLAWDGVLQECGYDATKRRVLYGIQECSSRIGQLINDYFDMDRGLQDFDRRVVSSHALLLYREVKEEDRQVLRTLWSSPEGDKGRYGVLLENYGVKGLLSQMIKDALVGIIACIRETGLDGDEKAILIAWHQMSFVHFNKDANDRRLLLPFIAAIDHILYRQGDPGVTGR